MLTYMLFLCFMFYTSCFMITGGMSRTTRKGHNINLNAFSLAYASCDKSFLKNVANVLDESMSLDMP